MSNSIICWQNLIKDAAYVINVGEDSPASPMTEAWNGRTKRPARPTADPSGEVQITFTLIDSRIGYDDLPYGYGPYDGFYKITHFIIGASRHDPIGFRFDKGSHIKLEAFIDSVWLTVVDEDVVIPTNKSSVFNVLDHDFTITYRLTITGLTPDEVATIPELFLGPALTLGGVTGGYDKYGDKTKFKEFQSDNGPNYRTIDYTQFTAKPSWPVLTRDYDEVVDFFREEMIEKLSSFWWIFNPEIPHKVYLVEHTIGYAEFKAIANSHSSFSLNLREKL